MARAGTLSLNTSLQAVYDETNSGEADLIVCKNRSTSSGLALIENQGVHTGEFATLQPGDSFTFRAGTALRAKSDSTATLDFWRVV